MGRDMGVTVSKIAGTDTRSMTWRDPESEFFARGSRGLISTPSGKRDDSSSSRALSELDDEDFARPITIRGGTSSVIQALQRSPAHVAKAEFTSAAANGGAGGEAGVQEELRPLA